MLDPKKALAFAKHLAKRFPERRRLVLATGARLAGWLASFAVLSAAVSFAVNGNEFFTKKVPQAVAYLSKTFLLGGTLRPLLIRRIVEQDLAYSGMCSVRSSTHDLDGDGDASDLILELLPKEPNDTCSEEQSSDTVYVILKLGDWKGVWPTYTMLRTLARESTEGWDQGTGYPMTFESRGSFLLGRIYGTDFPGYSVFGYANGVLHSFGDFRPIGSSRENETADSEPVMQIGNRMFLHAEEGVISFKITSDGQFVSEPLTSLDIVKRNNKALVVELFEEMPATAAATKLDVVRDSQSYISMNTDGRCGRYLFANGGPIKLEQSSGSPEKCTGSIQVTRSTVIVARTPCDFEGFRRAEQFPWGYVYDPAKTTHVMRCPYDAEHNSFEFEINVSLM
ncbi:hypothetical protein LJR175_008344 [Variovorax sp. LjRoot175]|uniref:hypothetical protein n=1 Tax=Variovorax sp. LjRoot175 TaxID=3342276 RepID=UPI003ED0E516